MRFSSALINIDNGYNMKPYTVPHNIVATRKTLCLRTITAQKKVVPRQKVSCNSLAQNAEMVSYYVGQSIILFTMFYCGLNWAHYREQRKKLEEESNDK